MAGSSEKKILLLLGAAAAAFAAGIVAYPIYVAIIALIIFLNQSQKKRISDEIDNIKVRNGSNKEFVQFLEAIQKKLNI